MRQPFPSPDSKPSHPLRVEDDDIFKKAGDTIQLCDRLFVSLLNAEEPQFSNHDADSFLCAWISNESLCTYLAPSSLGHLYAFHLAVVRALEESPEKDLLVLVEADPTQITTAAILMGGHMIIGRGMTAEEVAARFMPISRKKMDQSGGFAKYPDFHVEDCWRALHHATSLGWAKFNPTLDPDDQERAFIDMEEYLHYDDTANGAMHLVDPSRLLLFRCPADLPAGQAWRDVGGRREFGAEHYAGVFGDLDVRLVVRCGGARGGWDSGALRAAGIEVEDLQVELGEGAGMMAAVDRFLTLMRAVPGRVAVQCGGEAPSGGDDSDGEGARTRNWGGAPMGEEDAARLLVTFHLMRGCGFDAAAAVAWARMAHPTAPGPAAETRGGRV